MHPPPGPAGKSRFNLFRSTRAAYGNGAWWWHGEGPWECPYAQVRATMENEQRREKAFGAIHTATPELFPDKVLLFLDGPEHKAMRAVLMSTLTDPAAWTPRLAGLKEKLQPYAPKPCTLDSMTKETTDKMVAVAIWWMLFGVTLSPEEVRCPPSPLHSTRLSAARRTTAPPTRANARLCVSLPHRRQ